MLRWISAVPPQIVSDREKKNADIIWLGWYVSRPLARACAGQLPLGVLGRLRFTGVVALGREVVDQTGTSHGIVVDDQHLRISRHAHSPDLERLEALDSRKFPYGR